VSDDLAALVRAHPGARIAVAGDFFDLSAEAPRVSSERAIEAGFEAYPHVRAALGEHLQHGGELIFLAGNHDPELGQPDAKQRSGSALALDAAARDRVSVSPWFFRDEALHLEHGHLFDPDNAPLIKKVHFRNVVLQEVIRRLSLGKQGRGRHARSGRISYAQLGINQLGAVYENLLSYTGFFAKTDLYEVKPADAEYDPLVHAYFVTDEELAAYRDEERVYEPVRSGEPRRLLRHLKGKFVYRLAGRNREKSASYYTPESLTQCLVKYALKELLHEKTADEILASIARYCERMANDLRSCGGSGNPRRIVSGLQRRPRLHRRLPVQHRLPRGTDPRTAR
jgi:hypothetical protein